MAIPCSHALVAAVARCALAVPLFVPLGIAVYAPAKRFAKRKQLFFDRLVDVREVRPLMYILAIWTREEFSKVCYLQDSSAWLPDPTEVRIAAMFFRSLISGIIFSVCR